MRRHFNELRRRGRILHDFVCPQEMLPPLPPDTTPIGGGVGGTGGGVGGTGGGFPPPVDGGIAGTGGGFPPPIDGGGPIGGSGGPIGRGGAGGTTGK